MLGEYGGRGFDSIEIPARYTGARVCGMLCDALTGEHVKNNNINNKKIKTQTGRRVLSQYFCPREECSVLGHVCAPCAVCRMLPTRRPSTFSYVPTALCRCRTATEDDLSRAPSDCPPCVCMFV